METTIVSGNLQMQILKVRHENVSNFLWCLEWVVHVAVKDAERGELLSESDFSARDE